MEKLTSMVDFVLECTKKSPLEPYEQVNETFINKVINYANFLKQPLEIWMFVPCKLVGDVWVVLEEPVYTNPSNKFYNEVYVKEYQQAKERCFFDGVQVVQHYNYDNEPIEEMIGGIFTKNKNDSWSNYSNFKTIEGIVKQKPKLTKTAQKKLGL